MHLRRFRCENYRGFRQLEIDFGPPSELAGWTVFTGRNGAGKTTVLRAIADAIMGPFGRTEAQLDALRYGTQRTALDIEVSQDSADDPPTTRSAPPSSTFVLGSIRGTFAWTIKVTDHEPSACGPWVSEAPGWFAAGYSASRRVAQSRETASADGARSPRLAALGALFSEAPLIEGVSWLRDLDYRDRAGDASMGVLRDFVLDVLRADLLPDAVEILEVIPDGLRVRHHGVELVLEQLSDGYRTVAALVIDLVLRMHRAFGAAFRTERRDGHPVVPHTGVVLIDEVDLHLHVAWQQRIGFWFRRHFPNVQFLVTTHSPFVCQAAEPGGLIRLPAPGEDRGAERVSDETYARVAYGTVDDAVLTELFGLEGLHSERAEALRDRVAALEARVVRGQAGANDLSDLEALRAKLPRSDVSAIEQSLRKLGKLG